MTEGMLILVILFGISALFALAGGISYWVGYGFGEGILCMLAITGTIVVVGLVVAIVVSTWAVPL